MSSALQEEFEATYLVKELPEAVYRAPHEEILDIYIPVTIEHPILRVRQLGARYEITKKHPLREHDASHRIENTIPLTESEFTALADIPGKRVLKTRYYYVEEEVEYQVDMFKERLEGLVLVAVEFKEAKERNAFTSPSWFGADVTQEKWVAGGMLCGKSYDDIRADLEKIAAA